MKTGTVAVIGAGTMGAGIAQLCAQQGFSTALVDVSRELAEKALGRIEKGLAGRVEKGKMSAEEKAAILSRLTASGDSSPVREAEFVIESVVEDLAVKQKVFAELGRLAPAEALLATNTTSLSISAIADASGRPERVVQMHFFNPPVVMKLVEIMPGRATSPEALAAAAEFARKLGKEPVVCKKEAPGGIVSRILGAMLNEATWLVEDGVADPADIDKAMKLGAGHPMGPMELLDLIGLDVHRAKMDNLLRAIGDARYRHPEIVDRMIRDGRLGRKSGKGFHDYSHTGG